MLQAGRVGGEDGRDEAARTARGRAWSPPHPLVAA
jgi:hypothetical protein